MTFVDKLKNKLQKQVEGKTVQPEVQQQSTANQFKAFLGNKERMMNFANRVQTQVETGRQQRLQQIQQPQTATQQQTATQNVTGAQRKIAPVQSTNKYGAYGGNMTPTSNKLSPDDMKRTFKKYNPNATDEELNKMVEDAQKGKRVVSNQELAQRTVDNKEISNESKFDILKQVQDEEIKKTPAKTEEVYYDKGTKVVRDKRTGELEIKDKFFKEPESVAELKNEYQRYKNEGWTPQNVLSYAQDFFRTYSKAGEETFHSASASTMKGIAGLGEGIDDFKTHVYAQLVDWAGNTDKSKELRDEASDTGEWLSNIEDIQNDLRKGSALGKKGEQTFEGVGSSLPAIGVGVATGGMGTLGTVLQQGTLGAMAVSSAGNSLNESWQTRGKIDGLAWLKAGIDGATTYGTEELSGYLGKGATWDNKLASKINDYVKSSVGKMFVRLNMSAVAEGSEELEEYFANKITNSFMNTVLDYKGDEGGRYDKNIDMKEALNNFVMGYLSTLLTTAPSRIGNITMQLKDNGGNLKQTIDNISAQEEASAQREIDEANLKKEESRLKKQIKGENDANVRLYLQEQLKGVQNAMEQLNTPLPIAEQMKQVLQGRDINEVIDENTNQPTPQVENKQTPQLRVYQGNNDTNVQRITTAPFYEREITPENQEATLREINDTYVGNVNNIAGMFGITPQNVTTNIGGFTYQEGEKAGQITTELSYTFDLGDVDSETSDLIASLVGDLALEQQEAVISANYLNMDDNNADAIQIEIPVKNTDGVADTLHKVGINDFTIDTTNGKIILLDFSNRIEQGTRSNIKELLTEIGGNKNGKITWQKISSRYLDTGARRGLYEQWLGKTTRTEQNGQLYDSVTQALNKLNQEVEKNTQDEGSFNLPEKQEVPQAQLTADEKMEKPVNVKKSVKTEQQTKNTEQKGSVKIENVKELNQAVEKTKQKIEEKNKENSEIEDINPDVFERFQDLKEKLLKEGKQVRGVIESIIESDFQTEEAKEEALKVAGTTAFRTYSNKRQIGSADNYIAKYGWEKAYERVMDNLENDSFTYDKQRILRPTKVATVDDIALCERLIPYFAKTGQMDKLQNVIIATSVAGTEAGRTVQALSMIKKMTPEGQAIWVQRNVDRLNEELASRKGGKIQRNRKGEVKVIDKRGNDITK